MGEVVIIDYGAGNIKSLSVSLSRLGLTPVLSKNPKVIVNAKKVFLPGVGNATHAMKGLEALGLVEVIRELKQPVMGICLGMQMFGNHLVEGDCSGIKLIDQDVKPFGGSLKVPHMGWNTIENLSGPLFKGIDEGEFMYFVHSFFGESGVHTIATCSYGEEFSAAWQKDNFYGVQFHPEKSGAAGQQLLKNFIEL